MGVSLATGSDKTKYQQFHKISSGIAAAMSILAITAGKINSLCDIIKNGGNSLKCPCE